MLKDLPLDDIEQLKNYRDTEPITETDPDVIELSENIKKFEVLQPILVRPKRGQAGKYQLIFGHRRHVAAKLAGLMVIPCKIKDVPDEDILEIQVTENLQRKDCHPMDEAVAFRELMKQKAYSIEGIANRFAKKADYVALRLKLNDLIPDLQARFKKNEMPLGHAMLLCRLRQEDQKEVATKNSYVMRSADDLKDYINRNIVRQLSSAPFKRDDETLHPSAGPCTTCKKRSGCNQLLFADIKEDDRCFDKGCYQAKLDVFFLRQLKDVIETKPNVHIVHTGSEKLSKEVSTLLRQMNVTILDDGQYQRYGGYGKFKKQAKGFFLDGFQRGKVETIYVQGSEKKEKKDGKPAQRTLKAVKEEIAGIEQRQERALELDAEKTWKEVSDLLEDLDNLPDVPWEKPLSQEELNACAVALLEELGSTDYDGEGWEAVGIAGGGFMDVEEARQLTKATMPQLLKLLRLYMLAKLNAGMSAVVSAGPFMLMPVLRSPKYLKEKVEQIEAAQNEEAAGRIARAEKRLVKLREEMKELEAKTKPKKEAATAKAGAPKKRGHTKAKPSTSLRDLVDEDPEGEDDDE